MVKFNCLQTTKAPHVTDFQMLCRDVLLLRKKTGYDFTCDLFLCQLIGLKLAKIQSNRVLLHLLDQKLLIEYVSYLAIKFNTHHGVNWTTNKLLLLMFLTPVLYCL